MRWQTHLIQKYVQSAVSKLENGKERVESFFVKLGISLEIRKEQSVQKLNEINDLNGNETKEPLKLDYKIFHADTNTEKKLKVEDFTGNLRARYQHLQRILMQRADLQNLASIGKISNERQSLSIIGMVKEKRQTKNKNLIIQVEDMTGEIVVLVRNEKEELFKKANELILDEVVAMVIFFEGISILFFYAMNYSNQLTSSLDDLTSQGNTASELLLSNGELSILTNNKINQTLLDAFYFKDYDQKRREFGIKDNFYFTIEGLTIS